MKFSSVEDTNLKQKQIYINGNLVEFSKPLIMGIINVTEDSFYQGSRFLFESELIKKAEQHLLEGATFLDIGGFSSRPNANWVEESLELSRIKNAVAVLKRNFPNTIISVDTFRANVAQTAIDEGAEIINDISGFQFDTRLLDVIASNKVCYVLMHVEGAFDTMHTVDDKQNRDIVMTVKKYFQEKIKILHEKDVDSIVLDLGFGFSKTMNENFELLNRLDEFNEFNCPILVGISRKSMIYKTLGITPEEALNGTTVLNTLAILKGANILRVHDVKACKEAIGLTIYNG